MTFRYTRKYLYQVREKSKRRVGKINQWSRFYLLICNSSLNNVNLIEAFGILFVLKNLFFIVSSSSVVFQSIDFHLIPQVFVSKNDPVLFYILPRNGNSSSKIDYSIKKKKQNKV